MVNLTTVMSSHKVVILLTRKFELCITDDAMLDETYRFTSHFSSHSRVPLTVSG